MKVIIIVDDHMGMMFNHRRQSQDREVIQDIIQLTQSSRLLMSTYSSKLFNGYGIVDDDLLEHACRDDYCFIEDQQILLENIDELILYHWNRLYPADQYLHIDMNLLEIIETKEFSGYSHDKITRKIYRRIG